MSVACAVPMTTKKSVVRGSRTDRRKTVGPERAVKPPAAAGVSRPGPAPGPFPVVGIGASAVGLEALEKFFAHVAPDWGTAFVVVRPQHPGHMSLLPELLRLPIDCFFHSLAEDEKEKVIGFVEP